MTSKFEAQEGCHETSSILKTTNIRCYQGKFSCLGDLAPGICALLLLVILRNLMQDYFYWILYQDLVQFGTERSLGALYIIIYYLTFSLYIIIYYLTFSFFITVNCKYCIVK